MPLFYTEKDSGRKSVLHSKKAEAEHTSAFPPPNGGHLSCVYLFQEIPLYRAYGQEDTTKGFVMNPEAMPWVFIKLTNTFSFSTTVSFI